MKGFVAAALGLALATPAMAQQHEMHGQHAEGGMVASARGVYEMVRGYVTRSADQMPEADYSFKPTPDVRSFREMLGHIANANYNYCAIALGESNPNSANIEQTATDKAAMVKALGDSFAYCDRAYQVDEMKAHEVTSIHGSDHPRFYALVFNAAHDFEHYGNIVTYFRMKGMVPPSSQR